MNPAFRPNVAAILRRATGEILMAERSDAPGSWQFPQGGIKPGESAEEALHRELREEIGLRPTQYQVIDRRGPYRYLFKPGYEKEGFQGQEQTYFLLHLYRPETAFRLDSDDPEFRAIRWIRPEACSLELVPEFKRDVYIRVFADLLNTKL